jgi:hypothetical protein
VLLGEVDRVAADRVVAPQRVALPVVGEQDPDQVGVPLEADPEEIPEAMVGFSAPRKARIRISRTASLSRSS